MQIRYDSSLGSKRPQPQRLHFKDGDGLLPDITNPQFQELLLSWAERPIDAGVDAIWIDILFKQAVMLYRLTGSFEHPAVKESYQAAYKIV